MTARRRAGGARIAVGAGLLYLAAAAGAESPANERPVDELVDRIVELRGDVDDLDAKLESLKQQQKSEMSALKRKEGQLKSKKENQQLRIDKLEEKLAETRKQIDKAGVATQQLEPMLRDAIAAARDYVQTSLPFKRDERLAAIDKIERQFENGALEAPRVANRLWSFYADEIRLTGETGMFRQPIQVGGEERLADVVRLGMMMLYFRTDDERYGYAVRNGDGWQFRYAEGSQARERIARLFDAQRKQIRTGFFRLPNPSAAQGGADASE